METNELIELEYLEDMSQKAKEVLDEHIIGKKFDLPEDVQISQEMVEHVAQVVIDVAVVNTAIRAFHVVPYVDEHLVMVDVQDKSQQTVASVIVNTTADKGFVTADSVIVAFKTGAILSRHEELMGEAEQEHQEEYEAEDSESEFVAG